MVNEPIRLLALVKERAVIDHVKAQASAAISPLNGMASN
jgi:hypothetical protein